MPGLIRTRSTSTLLLLTAVVLSFATASAADAQTESPQSAGTGPAPSIAQESSPETDARIGDRLHAIYSEIEPLQDIQVEVSAGVVELGGEVDSTATAERALRLAGQLEGVVEVQDALIINRDLERRIESTRRTLTSAGQQIVSALPLLAVALGVFILFWLLGAWLGRRQALFRRISPNVFIASLLGQATHLLFVVLGLVVALVLLDATALLGTILGAAGIVGLAIGFAVRDTVENYIASILLSLRNPFSVNDLVDVSGQLGNVVTLTSRATILLSPEGNHIRIPNASVFKAVIINYTRRPERRFEFDVGVDADHDLQSAQQVAMQTLRSVSGVLEEPPVLVIVQALGDSNVVLRCYGWVNQAANSFTKVQSEAIRRVKEAFDEAGIVMPEPVYRLKIVDRASATLAESTAGESSRKPEAPSSSDTPAAHSPADVSPDRTIENRVIADARDDSEQNLLSPDAGRES